jgi:hypothetical protein
MFRVRKPIFICVSLKNVCDFPCFFSTICEDSPFTFPLLWISVVLFVLLGMLLV